MEPEQLNQDQRHDLQTHIQSELANLEREVTRLEQAIKPVPPDNAIGRLTRMEAIQSKSISEANLRRTQSRITRLRGALARIDDPEFGICAQCEEPIPFKRLMLVPEGTRCVECLS